MVIIVIINISIAVITNIIVINSLMSFVCQVVQDCSSHVLLLICYYYFQG